MPTGWEKVISTKETKITNIKKPPEQTPTNNSSDKTTEINRMEMFIPEEPQRSLDDLIVPSTVKNRIDTALNRIKYHDILYDQWNLKSIDPRGKRTTINLFGLPGTGKTFCAEAIAHFLKKKIIKVNYAEIESKYVGETPKNITAAFSKAKETDSVLFFDEADSILGKRLTNVTQSSDHGVNVSRSVMLLQLDKFDGVVIFATNLAKNYDGAFVRRILAHIEFELPDKECRIKLWKYLLPKEIPTTEDINLEWLANESEDLAGGDILNVIISAASRAVMREGKAQKVSLFDLAEEIKFVGEAKTKIGSPHYENNRQKVKAKETIIERGDLEPELRDRYDEAISKIDKSEENFQK
ncbi:MAG: ATP-binding protein [Trichodesmium sp. MAG_R04]|nr:ATP-binding protein [Trichodesmium sp. MAG_R04]